MKNKNKPKMTPEQINNLMKIDELETSIIVDIIWRRQAKEWSKSKLAKESGVSAGTIGRIESGAQEPKLRTILILMSALGMELKVVEETMPWSEANQNLCYKIPYGDAFMYVPRENAEEQVAEILTKMHELDPYEKAAILVAAAKKECEKNEKANMPVQPKLPEEDSYV